MHQREWQTLQEVIVRPILCSTELLVFPQEDSELSRLPNFGIGTAPLLLDDVIASAISFPSSLIEILVDIPDALLPLAGLLWLGILPLACLICEDTFSDVLGVVLVDRFVIVLVTEAVVARGRDVAADLVSLIGVD